MKISELKPCACCGGTLIKPPIVNWYVVRASGAMLHRTHAREVLGLNTFFGGAIRLAEAMAPAADEAVVIWGDKDPVLMTEFHVCMDCFYSRFGELGRLMEAKADEPVSASAKGSA